MSACNAQPPEDHPLAGHLVACHMAEGHDGPHTWETEPSLARRGIDRLLEVMAHREILSLDSQPGREASATRDYPGAPLRDYSAQEPGPWVLVTFVGGDQFAIWKATGAVYIVGPDGAVDDDPILAVKP